MVFPSKKATMELKPPESVTPTSPVYNRLQREAVDLVTQRYEDQYHKDHHRLSVAAIKTTIECIFLLVIAGLLFYAWQSGLFDGGLNPELNDELATAEVAGSLALSAPDAESPEEVPQKEVDFKDAGKDVHDRNVDAYSEVVRQFSKAKVDYWKNAPDIDRPGKSGMPLKFWCLTADENEVAVVLELSMSADAKMKVRRLSASSGLVESSLDEFKRLTAKNPYFVMREGWAYFSTKGKGWLPATVPAPQKDKALNPGQVEFGGIYATFMEMKMQPPEFAYDVMFEVKGGPVLKIATVRFGEEVAYGQFFSKVADHYGLSESEAMAIDAVLKMGKARIVSASAQAAK